MKRLAFSVVVLIINSIAALSQTAAPTPVSIETILSEAEKQTQHYRETFRDLLAEETKTFEEFDKNGNSKKKTSVKSNFLVYQSGKSARVTTELRNVVEVDGKLVPDSQQRAERFLAELEKEKTLEHELEKIQKESSRYDKTWIIEGLTLNEAVALAPNLRPSFDFKLLGTENFQGNEVYIVGYQQTRKSPYNTVNGKETANDELRLYFKLNIPGDLKRNEVFLRGKLWIDAKTFQIWREERELTVQTAEPLVLLANTFEYQPSEYGILIPKNITVAVFNLKKEKGSERYSALKNAQINFDYTRYRKTNVEVQISDDDS